VPQAILIAWDLLWLDDEDLRGLPLVERRRRLGTLLAGAPAGVILSQALDGAPADVVKAIAPLGIRGVVARPLAGGYDAAWHAISATASPIDWRRSLSPPPPLSNADKVLYPRDGICKRDIAGYYKDVAPLLVPHLLDRPVVIQRWPDGIDEFDWYQHRMPPRAPDYLRAAWVDGVRRIVIENGDALLWMANQAGLVYHGFASRLATIADPDWAMIDLDPGDRTTWRDIVDVALAIRKLLELLELPSVVKTSGQRGLHVLVPLATGHTFAQAEAFGDGIGQLLARLLPDQITLEFEKERRGGKLLVDTRQFMAKTLVVPYSLRGVDGAPVSTPLAWDELTPALDPRSFTLRSVRERLDRRGDLAAALYAGTARLDPALAQLHAQS
jgi:bifunctional non-homologous end joining protein LigD